MLTAITFIVILLVLVLIHEFGHYYAAKKNDVYVEEFGFGFPPRVIGKKIGETIYSLNLLPIGGFVKLYGEEYHEEDAKEKKNIPKNREFVNKKPWQKTIIITAGVIMNFLLGWILISYLFTVGTPAPDGVKIAEVQENSPAEAVGIQEGDKVLTIQTGDRTIKVVTTQDIITASQEYADTEISLKVQRDGETKTFQITPRSNPPEGQGSMGVLIEQQVQTKQYPWYKAPFFGLVEAFSMTKQIAVELAKLPLRLISQDGGQQVDVSGPIGIASIVGEARQYGINALLQITALLSLNLAVINILPFPALDGGRLMFIFYEWITKRKPDQNFEKYLNLIGIILLLSLMVFATVNDIMRLLG